MPRTKVLLTLIPLMLKLKIDSAMGMNSPHTNPLRVIPLNLAAESDPLDPIR